MSKMRSAGCLRVSPCNAAGIVVLVWVLGLAEGYPLSSVAAEIDVTPRAVAPIPPGTVIADGAPKGWSNLIIKSRPRVAAESSEHVSETVAGMARLLITAILANVQPEPHPTENARYYLSRVAAGVGMKVGEQDMIVSSDTQEKLGADLGLLDRMVLSGGQEHLQEMRCVARSRTMAILDAPSLFLLRKEHRQVVLRYAILVDSRTGRLNTLLWLLQSKDSGEYAQPTGPIQRLEPNKVEDCELHVDPNEFFLGFPTSTAFAMQRIPQGRETLAIPKTLKPIAAAVRLTPALAQDMEKQLRELLSHKQASD